MQTVDVLGTAYTIEHRKAIDDPKLINAGGYCDHSIALIVIDAESHEDDPDVIHDMDVWKRKALRHELVHAFLFESGLHDYSNDETLVDWIAAQMPKLADAMAALGCLAADGRLIKAGCAARSIS